MINILGDIHFRDDKDYFVSTCEEFLDWYMNFEYNNSGNTLILLGDLVEKALLSGRVAEFLERFIKYTKYKEVHIIVGNHDLKMQCGVEQLAYQFYINKKNILIHDTIDEVNIEGHNFLLLPHFNGLNKFGKTMNDFYSSLYERTAYQKHFDFCLGHVCGEDVSFFTNESIKNLDKLDVGKFIFGHIHNRYSNPDRYIGSVFAGKKDENDNSRAVICINGNSIKEIKLPIFNEFLEVTFPNELPISSAKVPIYTIFNCASEAIAREKYGNIFIRMVSKKESERPKVKIDFNGNFKESINLSKSLDEYLTQISASDEVKSICKNILNSKLSKAV